MLFSCNLNIVHAFYLISLPFYYYFSVWSRLSVGKRATWLMALALRLYYFTSLCLSGSPYTLLYCRSHNATYVHKHIETIQSCAHITLLATGVNAMCELVLDSRKNQLHYLEQRERKAANGNCEFLFFASLSFEMRNLLLELIECAKATV